MSKSSVQQILDTKRYSVQLIQGISETGARIYYALLMKKSMVEKTLKLIQEKKAAPEEVAVVLIRNRGTPPSDISEQVKKRLFGE